MPRAFAVVGRLASAPEAAAHLIVGKIPPLGTLRDHPAHVVDGRSRFIAEGVSARTARPATADKLRA